MPYITAIILAGGRGRRMKTDIPKQYMDINGCPLIFYTIRAFEHSSVDEIILVTAQRDIEYCRREIVDRYGFNKVSTITAGGEQRYDSVYNGLKAVTKCDYVLIHDGARACVTEKVIEDTIQNVITYGAAVAAVPVKDTIKQISPQGFVAATPDRNTLWQIQTPQAFVYQDILQAYDKMYACGEKENITDDAMVMELFGECRIKLFMSDYNNIKVTTPEDLMIVSNIVSNNKKVVDNGKT